MNTHGPWSLYHMISQNSNVQKLPQVFFNAAQDCETGDLARCTWDQNMDTYLSKHLLSILYSDVYYQYFIQKNLKSHSQCVTKISNTFSNTNY